jgi:hypothetical protein
MGAAPVGGQARRSAGSREIGSARVLVDTSAWADFLNGYPRRAFEDLTFLEPPLTQYDLIEVRAEGTVSDGVAPRPEPG